MTISTQQLAEITLRLGTIALGTFLKIHLYLSHSNEPDELTFPEIMKVIFDDDLGPACVQITLDHLEHHGYVSSRDRPDYELDPTLRRDGCPKRKVWRSHYPPTPNRGVVIR